jgi:hypothetical protein
MQGMWVERRGLGRSQSNAPTEPTGACPLSVTTTVSSSLVLLVCECASHVAALGGWICSEEIF